MIPEIKKIDDTTWALDEGGVRFFLLAGSERSLMIDSGMQTEDARGIAEEILTAAGAPHGEALVLIHTHADRDHIHCSDQFPWFYMHPAEATNFYGTKGANGEMHAVWDDEEIDLGDRTLRVIEIPGHTPGSVALLDEERRRLFSGDSVQDGRIFMFGPQREMHAYRASMEKLMWMTDLFDIVYPSHGSLEVKPELIEQLYDAAGRVLAGQVESREGEMFGHHFRIYDCGCATFLGEAGDQ
ncbi:MAG: MBL fold metallo-hydrolase [Lachnospiraceae bacterium]|nr:MBL fold metallo-hydrolase [Lachnospiraceae bacterium]